MKGCMRIVFLGTGDIGLPTLEWLLSRREHAVTAVVTQPDKPAGRRMELTPSPIKLLAQARGIPVLQPRRIREEAALEEIRAHAPDVILVMAYGQILPKALLDLPRLACLNLHASLLPRHRGAAPIQAAIEAGDTETGITVMYMAEGLDTGDMLLAHRIPITSSETAGSLHDRLAEITPGALAEALPLVETGTAPREPQDEARATYAPKLTREHGELDWSQRAAILERKVRALNPWPSAYTWLQTNEGARKLKVFASTVEAGTDGRRGGEVLRADKHGVLVAAGDGALLLGEVQLEGKKRMRAGDFLLGHPIPSGSVLGPTP